MTQTSVRPSNCTECAYWQRLREHEGLCRRYAPEAATTAEDVAHWPQTHSRQVCADGVVAATRPGSTCGVCLYWRRGDGGLNPTNRGDMPMAWWARAGYCVRHAPRPISEPGPRAFWKATADVDGCGEGEIRASATNPAVVTVA